MQLTNISEWLSEKSQKGKEVKPHVIRPEGKRPGPGRVCVNPCFGCCRCNCCFDDPRPHHRQRLQQTQLEPHEVVCVEDKERREGLCLAQSPFYIDSLQIYYPTFVQVAAPTVLLYNDTVGPKKTNVRRYL